MTASHFMWSPIQTSKYIHMHNTWTESMGWADTHGVLYTLDTNPAHYALSRTDSYIHGQLKAPVTTAILDCTRDIRNFLLNAEDCKDTELAVATQSCTYSKTLLNDQRGAHYGSSLLELNWKLGKGALWTNVLVSMGNSQTADIYKPWMPTICLCPHHSHLRWIWRISIPSYHNYITREFGRALYLVISAKVPYLKFGEF